MLSLDSNKWSELEDAYGPATSIPSLLKAFQRYDSQKKYWDNIWSFLCHQGTIYSATFAAFPYIVQGFKTKLEQDIKDNNIFAFATCVEISRQVFHVDIDDELSEDYFKALAQLNNLQVKFLEKNSSYEDLMTVLAYQAALKSQPQLSELLLNLNENSISDLANFYYKDDES